MSKSIEQKAVSTILSIANDLANRDPDALGAVSLSPYMANAVAVYSEYLKGDNYERIDWKSLNLPTLNRLTATNDEQNVAKSVEEGLLKAIEKKWGKRCNAHEEPIFPIGAECPVCEVYSNFDKLCRAL